MILNNAQSLVQGGILNNTIQNLMIARSLLKKLNSTITATNSTNSTSSGPAAAATNLVNNLLNSTFAIVTKVTNLATGQGINISTCTDTILPGLESISIGLAAKLASCPVDEVTKGVKMINDGLSYVTNLVNITVAAPQIFNSCLSMQNVSQQVTCSVNYINTAASTMLNAPTTVTNLVNNAYAYISLFPTNVAVCITNSSFSIVSEATSFGLNFTACVGTELISS